MTDNIVSFPSLPVIYPNAFKGAFNGRVYIGLVEKDPTIKTNQVPVYVWDNEVKIEIEQPLTLNNCGFIVYNGSIPPKITVEDKYSIAIYDQNGSQLYYFPDVSKIDPTDFSDAITRIENEINSINQQIIVINNNITEINEKLKDATTTSKGIVQLTSNIKDNKDDETLAVTPKGVVDYADQSIDAYPSIDFIYPSGNPDTPGILKVKTRMVLDNPHPDEVLMVKLQVLQNQIWGETGFYTPLGNSSFGAIAEHDIVNNKIIIQSAVSGILSSSSNQMNIFNSGGVASAPFRVLIWRMSKK